jgi:hypothetical protein
MSDEQVRINRWRWQLAAVGAPSPFAGLTNVKQHVAHVLP